MHGVYRSGPPRQLGAVVEVRERVLGSACVYSTRQKLSELVHEMAQHIVFRGSYQGAWSRWLNDQASWNIICIFVALSTRQSFSGWLNDEAWANIMLIFVTLSPRQSFSGWLNDDPHITV